MKKVFFGLLSVISLAGLVACGDPANSAGDLSEAPATDGEMLEDEATQAAPEGMPVEGKPALEIPEISDSDIEMAVQEDLVTLYPDTIFEVESTAGVVTISGDIAPQDVDYITEIVSEMDGVTSVDVQTVGPATLP